MSEISIELLISEHKSYISAYKANSSITSFGKMMNDKYHFEDEELGLEKDQLLASLMILGRHVKL